jgi:DNA replicative helicase MCM subunit Mcm2 (Cdc46/Mcm family)
VQVITATPRQLESLVRLSEALARMRLSPTVAREDVSEAIRLMKVCLPTRPRFYLTPGTPGAEAWPSWLEEM